MSFLSVQFFPLVVVESADTATSRMEREIIVVARVANKNETKASTELFVESERRIVSASLGESDGAISVAILIDAGPSQTRVLSGEKHVAAAVVRGLLMPRPVRPRSGHSLCAISLRFLKRIGCSRHYSLSEG